MSHFVVPKRWAEFRTTYENIDDARKAYHGTPYITALRNTNIPPWFEDPVEVYGIERARNSPFTPYAVLKHGEWFSVSSDNVDPDTWGDRV